MVAPEPYLSACLAVLNRAITLGRNQPSEPEMLFDVMDAVHAIPEYIGHWDHCDERTLRATLQRCDNRWPSGLLAAYEFILERRVV